MAGGPGHQTREMPDCVALEPSGWAAADVDEPVEPMPLPPDPQGSEPVGEEPPWLEHWLASTAAGAWDDDETPPGQLPSEMLASVEPGLFLAAELEGTDPRRVDEYHLVEMIAGYQRLASWSQHRMTELTGRLSRRPALSFRGARPDGEYVIDATALELAPRLGVSRFAAQRMVDSGRMFRLKLEDTGAALQQGCIDYAKANVMVRLLKDQPDDVAWEVQQMVLPDASHQTVTQLERAVSRAIVSIDPLRATARHKRAREQRRVNHPRPLPDGMASISAVLPVTDAAGLDLALESAARTAKAGGDPRTIDQLRADALALLGHGALEHGFIGVNDEGRGADAGGSTEAAAARADGSTDGAPAEGGDSTDGAAAESGSDADGAPADALRDAAGDPDGPVMHTGNAFLRTPCMPIGGIGGRRAQIKVTVPLSVLMASETLDPDRASGDGSVRDESAGPLSDQNRRPLGDAAPTDRGDLPEDDGLPEDRYYGPPVEVAELDGYGPITPDVARALAHSGGTWQRLVTDPLSGVLLDVGRTSYRPPAAIADFVRNRDRTCVRPGCCAPADSCQLDHVVPWEFGGVTSVENLGPMCTSDHPAKTVGAAHLHHLGGGAFQWTTPTGHHYLRDRTGRVTSLGRRSLRGDAAPGSAHGWEEPPF